MTSSNKVRLIFFEQSIGCDTCAATRRALQQLADTSDDVSLDILNLVLDREKAAEYGVDRVPATIISAAGRDAIRYYGAPLGHEWPTLVDAIAMARSGTAPLSEESRTRLSTVATPVSIQVFFTPSCVYCPRMIALANQIAVASPFVSALAIDATESPDLVRRYNVNGVPKTVINDTVEIMGAVSEEALISAIVGVET
jgi:glutaredoxin-like protein